MPQYRVTGDFLTGFSVEAEAENPSAFTQDYIGELIEELPENIVAESINIERLPDDPDFEHGLVNKG
jgi:hypothetical protein